MAMPTLLDVVKRTGVDAAVGLVEEVQKAHPEVMLGAARTVKGVSYRTLVRTALPTVGFRSANEGYSPGKSTYENRTFEGYIFNPRWECDKAVADASEDGAEAFIADEAAGIMEAAMVTLGAQFYYGTSNDAKGFPGLQALYNTELEVDAGGTTASTGSSVYAVKWGPRNVQWIVANNGEFRMSDITEQRVLDGSSNPYTAYCGEILSRIGLQLLDKYSVGRIKKLTADSGKGLTDARIASLLALFPTGKKPDVLFMTRRSLEQLRASRTATNPTGAPAPIPDEAFGVPIAVTDSIANTESVA